jgi:hypothetical protein
MRLLILFFTSFMFWGCSKSEDVNSLRITGSNTNYNHFTESEDGNYLLLEKNELRLLDASNPSSLILKDFGFDSLEIERVIGNSDTLLLQTKNRIVTFDAINKKALESKIPATSICDMLAKVGDLMVLATGNTDCGSTAQPTLSVYSLKDLNDIKLIASLQIGIPVDLKTYHNHVFLAEKNGTVKVIQLSASGAALKHEYPNAKAEELRVFPSQKRLLLRNDTGMAQYEISANTELKLLSVINETP